MLFGVRANSLQILALVLNGSTQHANRRLLTVHVCVCVACFEWILRVCEQTWVQVNERIVFELFAMVSCQALSVSVCEHVGFFFCLRVPKTPLNPANLNSAEMVRIIRVWIGASVGSRYAGCWLMIPTPAALWLTPNCPSNIHRSSTPSIHHGAGSELIISLEPLSKPAPASRLYFLILFHLISGCLHFFFYFLFISSSRARLISSILFFFFPPYFRKTTSLRLSRWSQNNSWYLRLKLTIF